MPRQLSAAVSLAALTPGAAYTLRLTATDSSGASSYATLTLLVLFLKMFCCSVWCSAGRLTTAASRRRDTRPPKLILILGSVEFYAVHWNLGERAAELWDAERDAGLGHTLRDRLQAGRERLVRFHSVTRPSKRLEARARVLTK